MDDNEITAIVGWPTEPEMVKFRRVAAAAAEAAEATVGIDAKRWRFLSEHWHSLMGGIPLHRWIDEQALRRGGVAAALDYAIAYHYNGERHIAGS